MKVSPATVGIVVGTAAVFLLANRAVAAAQTATKTIADQGRGALNPAHQNNVVSRFVEWMYGGGYDNQGTIGSDFWNFIHGREEVRP